MRPNHEWLGLAKQHPPPSTLQYRIRMSHFGTPTAWAQLTLGPFWLQQAKNASTEADLASARRKELLFSVAAAECFLVEWVRDAVYGNVQQTQTFFASRQLEPIRDRWKSIPKTLHALGVIQNVPSLDQSMAWQNFVSIIETRNALVHGGYSRPYPLDEPPRYRAMGVLELLQKPALWSVTVVEKITEELCVSTGKWSASWPIPQDAA